MSNRNLLENSLRNLGFGRAQQRPSTILALALDGGRMECVVIRRTNGAVQVIKNVSLNLSLDPLTNDPVLVGREIRNLLNAEGIRERRCVVALPEKWALLVHIKIPDIPESDIASFLEIESERGFPCDPATLIINTSRYQTDAEKHATIVGVPRSHVTQLENALRAAQLKPTSFSLGVAALQPPGKETEDGVLTLVVGDGNVTLQATASGGIAALRVFDDAVQSEGGQRKLQADLIAREARITLGQMTPDLRDSIRLARVFGPRDLAQQLADEIELRLESMELEVEVVTAYSASEFPVKTPTGAPVSSAFSLGARYLARQQTGFEFLPPRVSSWQQFTARYSAGKLQQLSLIGGVLLLAFLGAFGFQQWQLSSLKSEWRAMEQRVTELKGVQRKSTQFRPWYDDSFRGLTILKRLTEAFPEDGSVTAKLLEIRDPGTVTCTGTARDSQALLKTVERLRATPEIPNVSLGQTRGNSPLQFTFSFVWREGGTLAN